MSKKKNKNHFDELKEMIEESKDKEPVDKVIAVFCHRHGVSMDKCREYYEQLVAKGELKKE